MNQRGMIVIAITILIVAGALLVPGWLEQPAPDIVDGHRAYLEELLVDTGLISVPVVKNGFAYYELHTADGEVAGFIFQGIEEGWAGPISLLVRTDATGIIQRVYVWHHTETPGWVVGLDDFLATFAGFHAMDELVWQNDVHGITGSTVTAEAIILAVNEPGRAAYQKGIFVRE